MSQQDCEEEQQRDLEFWEEEQEYLASESAKAIADLEAEEVTMEFELTRTIKKGIIDRNFYEGRGKMCAGYNAGAIADEVAYEAQKELVKWQEGKCEEHFDFLIPRVDCPHCQLALLKHFELGVNDETRRQRKSRKTSR